MTHPKSSTLSDAARQDQKLGSCGLSTLSRSSQAALTLPQLSTPVRRLWPWRQTVGIVTGWIAGFGVARALDVAVPGVAGLLAALTLGLVAFVTALAFVGGILERDRARMMTIRRRVATRLARQSVRPA